MVITVESSEDATVENYKSNTMNIVLQFGGLCKTLHTLKIFLQEARDDHHDCRYQLLKNEGR